MKELNYTVDLPSKAEWWRYFAEYMKLVDLVFRELKEGEVTTVTLPLAYCIRHTLELGYKTNLLELEKVSGQKAKIDYKDKGAHRIDDLHKEFESQMVAVFEKLEIQREIVSEYYELNDSLRKLKAQLNKLDEFSFAFRYPVKNDGLTSNFKQNVDYTKNNSINFNEIKDLYDQGIQLLTYTTDVIAAALQRLRNEK